MLVRSASLYITSLRPGGFSAIRSRPMADERTDEELMRRYVAGDHEAFRALFDPYAPKLLRMTSRQLRSEELAREVVQQTFFQIHLARNDFRAEAKLRPWVFTIAMNLVREHYRRKSRRHEISFEEANVPARERGALEAKE